jgi:hypothetical protein
MPQACATQFMVQGPVPIRVPFAEDRCLRVSFRGYSTPLPPYPGGRGFAVTGQ